MEQLMKEMEEYEKAHSGVTRPTTLGDPSLVGHQSNSNTLKKDMLEYIAATAQGMKINLDYIRKNGGQRTYDCIFWIISVTYTVVLFNRRPKYCPIQNSMFA